MLSKTLYKIFFSEISSTFEQSETRYHFSQQHSFEKKVNRHFKSLFSVEFCGEENSHSPIKELGKKKKSFVRESPLIRTGFNRIF